MRIISGNLRGSTLYITKDKITRPLKDLVRESIFNLLTHSKKISLQLENSNILDLYAGTGSFGLECLSRQAKCVYFIENEKSAFEIWVPQSPFWPKPTESFGSVSLDRVVISREKTLQN